MSLLLKAQSPNLIKYVAHVEFVDSEERKQIDGISFTSSSTSQIVGISDSGNKTYFGGMNFCDIDYIAESLRDDTLRIRIGVKFVEKARLDRPFAPDLSSQRRSSNTSPVAELTSQLQTMLSEERGDITFVVKGGEVAAHKCILRARSRVFRAMLDAGMQESCSSRITIDDVDIVTMRRFLHFLYTGELPQEMFDYECRTESWGQLASAADKYAVKSLVDACAHRLLLSMQVQSPSLALDSSPGLEGRWFYYVGITRGYRIIAKASGYQFVELNDKGVATGELSKDGDWYSCELFRGGQPSGFIRLHKAGNTITSNFRSEPDDAWKAAKFARRNE